LAREYVIVKLIILQSILTKPRLILFGVIVVIVAYNIFVFTKNADYDLEIIYNAVESGGFLYDFGKSGPKFNISTPPGQNKLIKSNFSGSFNLFSNSFLLPLRGSNIQNATVKIFRNGKLCAEKYINFMENDTKNQYNLDYIYIECRF
jgi:hypothetical protein